MLHTFQDYFFELLSKIIMKSDSPKGVDGQFGKDDALPRITEVPVNLPFFEKSEEK